MGFDEYGQIINHYLDKRQRFKDKPNRNMSATEYLLVKTFQKLYKDMNVLITEVLTIAALIDRLGDPDLSSLVYNLHCIRGSLLKQRNKFYALLCTYLVVKPSEKELAAIKRFMSCLQNRISYVRASAIPYNLEFTPIQEYLEICQRNGIQDDLYDWFGTTKKMVLANSGEDPDLMEQYVKHVLDTVNDAGKTQDYEKRLSVFAKKRKEELQKMEQEKAEKRLKEQQEKGSIGMMEFYRMFNRAVFDLRGSERINMCSSAIRDKINLYGRNCFFVLCCYVYGSHYVFRYLGENDELVSKFSYARAFKDEKMAIEAKNRMADSFPDKVFDIIELLHIEKPVTRLKLYE